MKSNIECGLTLVFSSSFFLLLKIRGKKKTSIVRDTSCSRVQMDKLKMNSKQHKTRAPQSVTRRNYFTSSSTNGRPLVQLKGNKSTLPLRISAIETSPVTHWAILRETIGKLFLISRLAAGFGRDKTWSTSCNSSRYCRAVSRPAWSVLARFSFVSDV